MSSALSFHNASWYATENRSAIVGAPNRREDLTIQQVYEMTNWDNASFLFIANMNVGDYLFQSGIYVERIG